LVLFATVLTVSFGLALVPPTATAGAGGHPARRYGLIGAGILAGLWLLGLADAVLFGHHLVSGYEIAATLLTLARPSASGAGWPAHSRCS
jgi:hypothetical protein